MEVPTIISFSSLQRTMEQHGDMPVPGRGGRIVGLQGFLPGQGSSATLSSEERISEQIVKQIVDFTVSGGGPQEFRGSTLRMRRFEVFFCTFSPPKKSAKVTAHSSANLGAHSSSSTSVGWTTTRVKFGHCARDAPSGTRRGSAEPGRCWWCTGSRAWHPLASSWVLLPTPGQVKHTRVHGYSGVAQCLVRVDTHSASA